MSDADDSDFDKEAERERLREKYEEDQADREAAQQMSDLLLKGATMTNAHCDQCGSPIFRSDGQEFCPSCSQEAAAAADSADVQAGGEATDTDAATGTNGATEEPSPDERLRNVVSGGDAGDDAEPASTGGTSIAERAAASVQSAGGQASASQPGDGTAGTGSSASVAGGSDRTSAEPTRIEGDASLADAQQSLLNAITHHAQAATAADPRTAQDHLEAANEAAEALATISTEN